MIDSIFIAESGLTGFSNALNTISNDTANLNTPGFKGASTQFSDLFYDNSAQANGGNSSFDQFGSGVTTLGTNLNFQQGQIQSTGNPLDIAVNGQGFFVLKNTDGQIHYTKDGQFQFNDKGILVSETTGEDVMAFNGQGNLSPISIMNLKTNAAQATSSVTFTGNLSSSATTDSISNVTVIDSAGTSHALSMSFAPVSSTPGSWTVTLADGATTVGTGTLVFDNGEPAAGSDTISMTYTPSGGTAMPLTLDFSSNVTSFDQGTTSTLAVASQNGHASGTLTSETFDSTGTLQLTYSNSQTVAGQQLALGQFQSQEDVKEVSSNEFISKNGSSWIIGVAGTGQFGTATSEEVEMSNVDLSQEFSNLVIVQRGYQGCSQVISTASDMLNSLFSMWGK